MQYSDEELRAKRRKFNVKIFILLILLLLAVFFAARALLWGKRGHESELLSLVSYASPLSESHKPKLESVNGIEVDRRCAEELMRMLTECEAAGYSPQLTRGYISRAEQEEVYLQRVDWYVSNGSSEDEAAMFAMQDVFFPGTNEHELGLAVDIVDGYYRTPDVHQGETGTGRWLVENCHLYGFVLRYPEGKQSITGQPYSPWHFRYVGRDAAERMYQLDMTLEEYVMWFYSEEAIVIYS